MERNCWPCYSHLVGCRSRAYEPSGKFLFAWIYIAKLRLSAPEYSQIHLNSSPFTSIARNEGFGKRIKCILSTTTKKTEQRRGDLSVVDLLLDEQAGGGKESRDVGLARCQVPAGFLKQFWLPQINLKHLWSSDWQDESVFDIFIFSKFSTFLRIITNVLGGDAGPGPKPSWSQK